MNFRVNHLWLRFALVGISLTASIGTGDAASVGYSENNAVRREADAKNEEQIPLLITMLGATIPARIAQPMAAGGAAAPTWSFVISTAPGLPQDVWVTGRGNNQDGWRSAGVFCLGPLAQGLGPTQHATVDADVIQAGIYGIDGTPVPPGTYTLPGGVVLTSGRTGPAELLGPRDYTLTPGQTFFIIFETRIVESDLAILPKGLTLQFMFTFDFKPDDPDAYGNRQRYIANWVDFTGAGEFTPFLNEGLMMTNVRLQK